MRRFQSRPSSSANDFGASDNHRGLSLEGAHLRIITSSLVKGGEWDERNHQT